MFEKLCTNGFIQIFWESISRHIVKKIKWRGENTSVPVKKGSVGGFWHGLKRNSALPLVDCKWQSKFTLSAGAKMEADSFVGEFEKLSGRAENRDDSVPFISKSPAYAHETSMVILFIYFFKEREKMGKRGEKWEWQAFALFKIQQWRKEWGEKRQTKVWKCRANMSEDVSTFSNKQY